MSEQVISHQLHVRCIRRARSLCVSQGCLSSKVCRCLQNALDGVPRTVAMLSESLRIISNGSGRASSVHVRDQVRCTHWSETSSFVCRCQNTPSSTNTQQVRNMREIVHMQGGQCVNQIGAKFWEVRRCPRRFRHMRIIAPCTNTLYVFYTDSLFFPLAAG